MNQIKQNKYEKLQLKKEKTFQEDEQKESPSYNRTRKGPAQNDRVPKWGK